LSKRIRKFFGNIQEVAEMPNLIEVQKDSYDQFLQVTSLKAAGWRGPCRRSSSRCSDPILPAGDAGVRHATSSKPPKYDVEECQQRG
jgi:DNA-directed RNA polymerase subunit beta